MNTNDGFAHMRPAARIAAACLLFACIPCIAWTALADVHQYAVEASATWMNDPTRVSFAWPVDPSAEYYHVFKRVAGAAGWPSPVAILPGDATGFTDSDVDAGLLYEYSFRKSLAAVSDTLPVPDGTRVVFTIYDAWGDGMCCHHGFGSYEVAGCGAVYAEGGDFGASEATAFEQGSQGGCDELVVSLVFDFYTNETSWTLTEESTGDLLGSGGSYAQPKFGHLRSGTYCAAVHDRGTILILAEGLIASQIEPELERLRLDLIGDGYRVRRIDVFEGAEVTAIKEVILTQCAADPTIETLLLIGHVPVPYSGDVWSGHANHRGAWPADVYYAELDGEWTDDWVNNTTASRPENHNVPGDGKFDQTFLPSDADLMIGRVDLSRLPAFNLLERDRMRRYLYKNHAWRQGQVEVEPRGLIDDNVGDLYGFAPASCAWRNFAGMFTADQVFATDYLPTLETESYLWSYGCGGSGYTHCGGVASTQDFAARTFKTVFTSLYGSYFGDWDNEDNVLRSPLASEGFILTNMWSGRPVWHWHPMSMGATIGECARLTQNDVNDYMAGDGNRQIHIALMGDPTLRMHVVPPISNLSLTPAAGGAIDLAWSAAPGTIEGYHVYRGGSLNDRLERLTVDALPAAAYRDEDPLPGNNVYMIRALRRESSASGSYDNLSCGVIDSLSVSAIGDWPLEQDRGFFLAPLPNPVLRGAVLHLALPESVPASLRILDVTGAVVREWALGTLAGGSHEVRWDGTDEGGNRLPAGVYFAHLRAGADETHRRLLLLR